jgi:hypothetical protein
MPDPQTSFFSPDYATARARFIDLAQQKGATTSHIDLSAKGPKGLPLTIDIAVFGSKKPKKVLLHCSGLHGIEGFAGSAIQLALLSELVDPPDDCATVFVHALNPFGMAWLRRVNENNVDLNRNFLDQDEAYAGAPDHYTRLNPMMNPKSPPTFDFFLIRTIGSILKSGFNALKQSIVGGQYEYPNGLFFGGKQLEEGPTQYLQWLREHLSTAEHVVAIDIHTGLGKQGFDTLLVDGGPENVLYQQLEVAFGDHVAPWDPENSVAYEIRGGHSEGIRNSLTDTKVHFVTQEFGTLPPLKVLHALREENRWHHWGPGTEKIDHLEHPAKQNILHAFRPDLPNWRNAVIDRGMELAEQAKQLAFASTPEQNSATTPDI